MKREEHDMPGRRALPPSSPSPLPMLLAPEKIRLSAALAVALVAALAELLPYVLLSHSVATVLSGTASPRTLCGIVGLLAGALLLKYLFYSLAYYFSHVAAFRLLAGIRRTLVHRLALAPPLWLQQHASGELKKIVLQDVERLEQFIAHHTVECVVALASPVFVAAVLFWIDWRLAAAALVTVPLAVLAQTLLMRGFSRRIDDYNRAIGELDSVTVEYVRNIPVMKVFRQHAQSFHRMRELLSRYHGLVAAVTRQTVPGWSVFTVLLGANMVFLLPTGLWLYRGGAVGPMELMLALTLGSGMLRPLFKVAHFSSEIRAILAGMKRIAPILALHAPQAVADGKDGRETMEKTQKTTRADVADVIFDRVSFSYGSRRILDELSFTLPAGSVTALVGPSGAGKSTVARLLEGAVVAGGGTVRVGGEPLSALGDEERSRRIMVATQEVFLFRGTVLENLRLGCPEADEETVRRAARSAQAEAFIDALPQGFATVVGERGASLSGGERQRLAIARALLRETPILVLDEATAFADSRTERRFYQALRRNHPGKTLLFIAHRLHAIVEADQILVMEEGCLLDAGRHEDLLRRCALYRDLWQRQSEGENWSLRAGKNAEKHAGKNAGEHAGKNVKEECADAVLS